MYSFFIKEKPNINENSNTNDDIELEMVRDLGKFEVLPTEIIYFIFLFLSPAERLMLGRVCKYFHDCHSDIKKRIEYQQTSTISTALKPLGYVYKPEDSLDHFGNLKLYYPKNDANNNNSVSSAEFAKQFLESMLLTKNSNTEFIQVRNDWQGITGKEACLEVNLNLVANNLTIKNTQELLNMLKCRKPCGVNFSHMDEITTSILSYVTNANQVKAISKTEYYALNLYFSERIEAALISNCLRNLFKNASVHVISNNNMINHTLEFNVIVNLTKIDLDKHINNFQKAFQYFLTPNQFKENIEILNKIFVISAQLKESATKNSKPSCRLM